MVCFSLAMSVPDIRTVYGRESRASYECIVNHAAIYVCVYLIHAMYSYTHIDTSIYVCMYEYRYYILLCLPHRLYVYALLPLSLSLTLSDSIILF